MIIRINNESSAIPSDQLSDLRNTIKNSKFNSPKRKRHSTGIVVDGIKEYDSILIPNRLECLDNRSCSLASSTMSESFNLTSSEEKTKETILIHENLEKENSFKFIGETFDNRFGSFCDRSVKDTDSINSGDSRQHMCNSTNRLTSVSAKPNLSSSEVWSDIEDGDSELLDQSVSMSVVEPMSCLTIKKNKALVIDSNEANLLRPLEDIGVDLGTPVSDTAGSPVAMFNSEDMFFGYHNNHHSSHENNKQEEGLQDHESPILNTSSDHMYSLNDSIISSDVEEEVDDDHLLCIRGGTTGNRLFDPDPLEQSLQQPLQQQQDEEEEEEEQQSPPKQRPRYYSLNLYSDTASSVFEQQRGGGGGDRGRGRGRSVDLSNNTTLASVSADDSELIVARDRLRRTREDLNNSSSSSSFSSSSSSSSLTMRNDRPRPLPDQSAFDQRGTATTESISMMYCPPTPIRTPTWGGGPTTDVRSIRSCCSSSLVDNKVLLQQSDDDNEHNNEEKIDFHTHFHNLGLVGSGTFADVFKVQQIHQKHPPTSPTSDRQHDIYAVKKSRKQFRSKRDRDWLLNEVHTMKRLNRDQTAIGSKHVVQFVRAWQEDSFFFVQIEFADKGTIKDMVSHLSTLGQIVPTETIWHLIHDVSLGLKHIHDCGMVHLDIKPANLLVTKDGLVKIGDFGMAVEQGSREDGHEGDARYMAMELLNNLDRCPSADVFSFGLSLYETCHCPFLNNWSLPAEGHMWHVLRSGQADPVHNRSQHLTDLIVATMSLDPTNRPTAQQLLEVLEVCNSVQGNEDETIRKTKSIAPNSNQLHRSVSFMPIVSEDGLLTINTQHLSEEEHADLFDRAVTPHY